MTTNREVTVIAGVGPGLGLSLAERFAAAGHVVAMLARTPDKLAAWTEKNPSLRGYPCDVTDPASVKAAFAAIDKDLGAPSCAVFNAGAFERASILDVTPESFERCFRVGCLAGLLIGQEAARRMVQRGSGTILFTGATASLRGSAYFVNLASPKFALRAVAQSMARELGPKGIHVAHVIVDGMIRTERVMKMVPDRPEDGFLDPAAIAEVYVQLHAQPKSAWTHEIDLRPYAEKF